MIRAVLKLVSFAQHLFQTEHLESSSSESMCFKLRFVLASNINSLTPRSPWMWIPRCRTKTLQLSWSTGAGRRGEAAHVASPSTTAGSAAAAAAAHAGRRVRRHAALACRSVFCARSRAAAGPVATTLALSMAMMVSVAITGGFCIRGASGPFTDLRIRTLPAGF